MRRSWRGVGTVALVTAISSCGLLWLAGAGSGDADRGGDTPATVIETAPEATTTTAPATTAPATTTPITTESPPDTTSTTTTTTTTTTTSTTTTSTTTTTIAAPAPVPTVTASQTSVGVGGTVTFDGTCSTDVPVEVWITDGGGGSPAVVDTGITTSPWTYVWTAPADADDASSFGFQFWCGGPTSGASIDDQPHVDMVASAAPPAPAPARPAPAPVGPVLPETS